MSEMQPFDVDWSAIGGQIALGTLIGIAVGFTIKKTLKLGLVLVGLLVLVALALQQYDVIVINWTTLEQLYNDSIQQSGGLFVMLRQWAESIGSLIPVAGSFVVGFLIGMRLG